MTEQSPDQDPFTRVCRKCSTQSATNGGFCPNCGTSYASRKTNRVRKRTLILAIAGTVLVAATAAGLVLKTQQESQAKEDRIAAAAEADQDRIAANQSAADDEERTTRASSVKELEKYIKKHAKKNAKAGLLEGPILSASCTATGGGSTDDLTALTGTFDCLAVNKENSDDTMSGYSYKGTIDWKSGEMTWQIGG